MNALLMIPHPIIGVLELADSSVNLAVTARVKTTEYWMCTSPSRKTSRNDSTRRHLLFLPQRVVHRSVRIDCRLTGQALVFRTPWRLSSSSWLSLRVIPYKPMT
jgi:small-conductance mechanosensitive channel